MSKPIPFEKHIQQLESIVNSLEAGDLSLDESLKQFEKGIALARQCQTILEQAEQKIDSLSKNSNTDKED